MDKFFCTNGVRFRQIPLYRTRRNLPDYGITGVPMPQEWIINYLFNRSQQVTLQNTLFRPEPTVCGVPQGSILGPLLFVLYIDDITTSLHQAKIVKYADDTVIFYSNKDAEVIQTVLNNEFSSMTNWLRNNELIINTKRGKTEVTLFGTSKRLCKLNNPPLKIVNNFGTIIYTKLYKYLGLILNETLNMSEHMKVTMKGARSRVNLLRRIRPLMDADTASLIFKVIILPILRYCPYSTFGNIPNYVENKVQNIENCAQKIIGKPLPYSTKNFQKRRIVTYVHQRLTNNVCKNFENYFEVIKSKINTRNNGTLIQLPKVKLEVTRKSFFFQDGYDYNREIRSGEKKKNVKAKNREFYNQQN